MQRYRKQDGDSGVVAYDAGPDFIRVAFRNEGVYLYTYESTGAEDVEQMKRLAAAGDGLATYISTRVKDRYARRER